MSSANEAESVVDDDAEEGTAAKGAGDDAAKGPDGAAMSIGASERIQALVLRFRRHARVVLPLIVTVAMLVAGNLYGPGAGVLVLAAAALAFTIGAFWTSVRALAGETPLTGEDSFALGAPSAEEEQKRSVLRAIKDIEFERTVGKLAEEDFAALHARYRAEAKRLLARIDEGARPERARVAALVAARLAASGLGPTRASKSQPASEGESKGAPEGGSDAATEVVARAELPKKQGVAKKRGGKARDEGREACARCSTLNDEDARFCKGCGHGLKTKEAT
ncbi:MAG: zinc ribbon domain-containing protein [Myxococcales bacterium]|nr:zinc ribbon domain-containing protein [Myxococcales bacterium]